MRTLIILKSYHHRNTQKIAERIAPILEAKITGPEIIDPEDLEVINELNTYDLIGFGSGIYMGNHHKDLTNFVKKLPSFFGKQAFIFSTCGGDEKDTESNHALLRNLLLERKFDILGEFSCKGWDSVGPLRLIGGIHRDRPNEEDFKNAENFARDLRDKHPEVYNGNNHQNNEE